jgi:protocatechuate 3,4-dioxygenase beta subunit
MKMLRTLVTAVALALMVFPAAAEKKDKREEANTRTVQGVVLDANDNPVSGAIVQLKDTKTLQVRSFITQDKGEYHFSGLSTNVDYELKADHGAQSSGTKLLSVFDSRKKPNINLKLK